MKLAPAVVFAYNRLECLKNVISALQKDYLAKDTELYIFSDGAKSEVDKFSVQKVREYLCTIIGFKKVFVIECETNQGLANSIIIGVTEMFEQYENVIVIEDDLETSPNFLSFMNAALNYYRNDKRIFSISGFSLPIKKKTNFDNYFAKRGSSWGWATWKNRWQDIDWEVDSYESFVNDPLACKAFNSHGSDMTGMLKKQMEGKINSWAIRWCYHQFQADLYTVYPTSSKVQNIGFGEGATHTRQKYNRYFTKLDTGEQHSFAFDPCPRLNDYYLRKFKFKYSLPFRTYAKLREALA